MSPSDNIAADQSAEDVLKLLDSLDNEATTAATSGSIPAVSGASATHGAADDGDDIMGFLDSLTGASKTASDTEKAEKAAAPTTTKLPPAKKEPAPGQQQPEAAPVEHHQQPQNIPDPISSLTSWWSKNKGGLWDSAASAVKQAEARVRELQPETVVGTMTQRAAAMETSLGDSFSKFRFDSKLLQSTLTSVLDTIAPPLARHEQLQIHVFHDMVGYPAIDKIVYSVFERVMDQVEGGGELTLVVQKGRERNRRGSGVVEKRELGIFKGSLEQGQKLAAASIEEYLRSVKAKEEAEQAGEASTDKKEEEKPETVVDEFGNISRAATSAKPPLVAARVSNIYLSIQPISTDPAAGTPAAAAAQPTSLGVAGTTPAPTIISSSSPHAFQFIVFLTDPEHSIHFSTVSQAFPVQWAEWLDSPDDAFPGAASSNPAGRPGSSSDASAGADSATFTPDPREWVIDWVEEGLGLSVGVVAQTYVSKRMGLSVLPPTRVATPKVA